MKKTNEHILLAELLAKEVANELSNDEKKQLNFFLLDKTKKDLIDTARNSIFDEAKLNRYQDFDIEAARQKIEWKIKFRKNNRRLQLMNFVRYAAVISLPIALTAWLIYSSVFVNQSQIAQAPIEITPGGQKAMLYLSDGRPVDLDSKNKNTIKEADGSLILKDKTGLNYSVQPFNIKGDKILNNVVTTPVGGEYQLTLPDGTKVWLNANSEISFPVTFTGDTRKVAISGEVYFDVAKNKDKPFYVNVGDVEIKVLGTQFNVMAYPDEKNIETTLVEGAVRLMGISLDGKQTEVDLKPGHKADFSKANQTIEVNPVNTDIYTAWKDGRYIFKSQKLENIMNTISRWYDIEIIYEDVESRNIRFTGNFERDESFGNIIMMLEMMKIVSIEVEGNKVFIRKL